MTTRDEIVSALQLGKCFLTYTKLNGEIRSAVGTLNMDFVPKDKLPKKQNPKFPSDDYKTDLIHYYDFIVEGWRCFWAENIQILKVL